MAVWPDTEPFARQINGVRMGDLGYFAKNLFTK